MELRIKIKIL